MTDRLNKTHYSHLTRRMRDIIGAYAQATRYIAKTDNVETATKYYLRMATLEDKFYLVADYTVAQAQSMTRKKMYDELVVRFEAVKTNFYETTIEKVEKFGII